MTAFVIFFDSAKYAAFAGFEKRWIMLFYKRGESSFVYRIEVRENLGEYLRLDVVFCEEFDGIDCQILRICHLCRLHHLPIVIVSEIFCGRSLLEICDRDMRSIYRIFVFVWKDPEVAI